MEQCFLTQFPLQCFVNFSILKVVFFMCQVPIVCLTLDLAGFGHYIHHFIAKSECFYTYW